MTFSSYRLGPSATPKLIKIILALTAFINLLIALIPHKYLGFLLGLSKQGIENGFVWQIFTNLFIIENPSITFGFVLHLIFNLSVIWIIGTSLIELKGIAHFIYLVSVSSIFSSSLALALLFAFSSSSIFFGGSIIIYVIAMGWLMLHSDAKILLFSTIPFKGKWLILGLMAINLISLLSEGAYMHFSVYLSSIFFSYMTALILWKVHSPFLFLKNMEHTIINFLHKAESKAQHRDFKSSKIYDFKTGEPIVDDDEFMDAMLTRISLYGEEILTKSERKRMEKISKKKQKNQK